MPVARHPRPVVAGRFGGVMGYPVRYAKVDGLNLAYQVVGDGPIDLVLVDEWATPLEGRWDVPAIASRLDRLASFARVISFDKRGIGLSDPFDVPGMAMPELWVRDVVAVVDAAGARRPVLFGAHEGGPIALLYAASLPERTDALILVNTGPRLLSDGPEYPWGMHPSGWQPDLDGIVEVWERGDDGAGHISAIAHDPWWRDWYSRARRQQASPAMGLALLQMLGQLDVRQVLAAITAPTLVVHRRENRWWDVHAAHWMATQVPNATFVELVGGDNYWWAGDADRVVDEIEHFLLGERTPRRTSRQLATMMFTDVVDSTSRASELGDVQWRTLLEAHDTTTVAEAERHGGTVVKQLGDGYLLTFAGPGAAIQAGRAIQAAVGRIGLDVRIAVHTGEVEVRDHDITGVAVNLTSRLLGVAAAGDLVVSGTVRGLVAGSGINFESLGQHQFKGIQETWDVYRVVR
jgi:class 3 adenylate cyclase